MKRLGIFFLLIIGTVESFWRRTEFQVPVRTEVDASMYTKGIYEPINTLPRIIFLIRAAVEHQLSLKPHLQDSLDENLLDVYWDIFKHLSWRAYHSFVAIALDHFIAQYVQSGSVPLEAMRDQEQIRQELLANDGYWYNRIIQADQEDKKKDQRKR